MKAQVPCGSWVQVLEGWPPGFGLALRSCGTERGKLRGVLPAGLGCAKGFYSAVLPGALLLHSQWCCESKEALAVWVFL